MPEEQDIPKQPSNERESADVIMQASPISPSETQPTDMEVHHHPDLHHKPKKWKEYFLEFLMIFLAVTLGFFAENIREHFTDKNNTKVYLETYRDELTPIGIYPYIYLTPL
jgi:hypothetical protein